MLFYFLNGNDIIPINFKPSENTYSEDCNNLWWISLLVWVIQRRYLICNLSTTEKKMISKMNAS